MRAGKLRHRVKLQKKQLVSDGDTGHLEQWPTQCTLWAEIKGADEAQRFQYDSVGVEMTHQITVRGSNAIYYLVDASQEELEKHRLEFKGRIFEIKTVQDTDERGMEYVIPCRELR